MKLGRKSKKQSTESHIPEPEKPSGMTALLASFASWSARGEKDWYTPWSWADARRIYWGEDGFWAYRQLPLGLLDKNRLKDLLRSLHTEAGSRDVHLLLHSWSDKAILPPSTPPRLAGLLEDVTEVPAPKRSLILGIKLLPSSTRKSGLIKTAKDDLMGSLDDILGESVPDFTAIDEDLTKIDTILSHWSATPVGDQAAGHLEYWYLLGASTDPTVVEEEDHIDFGALSTLVCLSATDILEDQKPGRLPAAEERTSMCLSLRGKTDNGRLTNSSNVIARRSSSSDSWKSVVAKGLGNGTLQHLPMRQLPALSETLPCSNTRVTPTGADFPYGALRNIGFSDPVAVGDPFGLHLGLASTGYSDPCWWNPSSESGNVLVIAGGTASGKTLLGEYLAIQGLYAGYEVVFFSGNGESGRPLIETGEARAVTTLGPGMANPGEHTHERAENEAIAELLASLTPQVPGSTWYSAVSTPSQEDYNLSISLNEAIAHLPERQAAAWVIKTLKDSASLKSLLEEGQWPTGNLAIAMGLVLRDVPAAHRKTYSDLILASCIKAPRSRPLLIIADDMASGPITVDAVEDAAPGSVAVVAISSDPRQNAHLPAKHKLVLGCADPAEAEILLNYVGVAATEERKAWLIDARPKIVGGNILAAPAGILKDSNKGVSSVIIAPLPGVMIGPLTRGSATDYK